jgi:hypothetical protein
VWWLLIFIQLLLLLLLLDAPTGCPKSSFNAAFELVILHQQPQHIPSKHLPGDITHYPQTIL